MAPRVRILGSDSGQGSLFEEAPEAGLRAFSPELFLDQGSAAEREVRAFQVLVLDYFRSFGRGFPWRETHDPWEILVSEIMLQQTQTDRVLPKYEEFLKAYPRPADLSVASVAELFGHWKGLGYNRRALALKNCAAVLVGLDAAGRGFPDTLEGLLELPGVGPYTARALLAFAFHRFEPLIETNVRTVYLAHFYPGKEGVPDSLLMPLIARSGRGMEPRTWYYALMDYGSFLKRKLGNANRRSAHYARQSPFATSNRRIRGQILKILHEEGRLTRQSLESSLPFAAERVESALGDLVREGFVGEEGGTYGLA